MISAMRGWTFLALTVSAAASPLAMAEMPAGSTDPLITGFQNPPRAARPSIYWLWLNGYVNKDYLQTEIKAFSDHGVGGLLLFDMGARGDQTAVPPAGPAFMSDKSMANIGRAVKIAERYEMTVQLAACSSWDLGGSWVEPEDASMALYRADILVNGPRVYDDVLPFPDLPDRVPRNPDGSPEFWKDVAVLAVPASRRISVRQKDRRTIGDALGLFIEDKSDIVDLSHRVGGEGRLRWAVPEGKWAILRFVCANTGERLKVPSPNSDGLATDHFSGEATEKFLRHLIERLERRLGELSAAGISELYLPSYEVRDATWTPDFIEQYREYCGYDLTPFLPVLAGCVVESEEITERFLHDYDKTLGDLLVDAYYRTAREVAHQAGLGIEAEAGGPGPPVHQVPVDSLKALGAIDEVRGEFWPWRMERDALWVVKETACAAHIYGKPRVHMEAFTGFRHWEDGPFELKPSADRAFCEGMNHVVWHTAAHQPPEAGLPGWVYGAGSHLTPNLIWWSQAKPFLDYLARCSFLLQQGAFVGDVCFYYGDQGFNFVPPKHVRMSGRSHHLGSNGRDDTRGRDSSQPKQYRWTRYGSLLPFGYDYDVANAEVICQRMHVDDGRIALPGGMQYELLVLPDRRSIDLDILKKLEALVKGGATVVGPKPLRSNGFTDFLRRDQEVRRLADKLWGDCDGQQMFQHQYGAGRVIWGRELKDILRDRGITPDFCYAARQGDPKLDFIHRRTDQADIYFVSNTSGQAAKVDAWFRVQGQVPEIWFPDSGQMRQQAVYEQTEKGLRVPLTLNPHASLFVVFRKPIKQPHLVEFNGEAASVSVEREELRVEAASGGTCRARFSNGRNVTVDIDKLPDPRTLDGPWDVQFHGGLAAPPGLIMQELRSWTDFNQNRLKYYSGCGTYKTEFTLPSAWLSNGYKLTLDLGALWAAATVTVNGRPASMVWKPPYQVDVTSLAQAGKNELSVDVANTWSNRLVGDARSPADQRHCRTNITGSGTPRRPWSEVPLNESGLLGPVTVIPSAVKAIGVSRSEAAPSQ